jgi:hypothetical protein
VTHIWLELLARSTGPYHASINFSNGTARRLKPETEFAMYVGLVHRQSKNNQNIKGTKLHVPGQNMSMLVMFSRCGHHFVKWFGSLT